MKIIVLSLLIVAVVACCAAASPTGQKWDPAACASYNESNCNHHPECAWNNLGFCFAGCGMFTTMQSCRSAIQCRWFFNNNSCEGFRNGCSALPSISMCNKEGRGNCKWQVIGGIPACHSICRGYSINQCQGEDKCIWDAAEITCKAKCRYRYSAGETCNFDPLCTWSGGPYCADTCTKLNYTLCQASPQCQFDISHLRCGARCSANTNAAACNDNIACTWNSLGFCTLGCGAYTTQLQCRSAVQCRWFFNNNSCANGVNGCLALTSRDQCMLHPRQCNWGIENGIPACRARKHWKA